MVYRDGLKGEMYAWPCLSKTGPPGRKFLYYLPLFLRNSSIPRRGAKQAAHLAKRMILGLILPFSKR